MNSIFNKKSYLAKSSMCMFIIFMVNMLESCYVTRTRVDFANCAGTTLLTDSKTGYYNRLIRVQYFAKHTQVKK